MNDEWVKVRADDLKDAIDLVRHAAARDFGRPILAGILFERELGTLRLVAADNYRLATAELTVDEYSPGPWSKAVVPIEEIPLVRSLLAGRNGHTKPGPVTLTRSTPGNEDYLLIETMTGQLRLHVVQGNYPNYRGILEGKKDEVDRRTLTVQAKYLNEIAKMPRTNVGSVKISFAGPQDPIKVTTTRMNYTETIMPARDF